MKRTEPLFFSPFIFLILLFSTAHSSPNIEKENDRIDQYAQNIDASNSPPVAVNDTLIFPFFDGESYITGNLLENDFDPEDDEFVLTFLYAPKYGQMMVDCDGFYTYLASNFTNDTIRAKYIICETYNWENCGEAEIIIIMKNDHDNDGVANDFDIDNDNDGILDIDETFEADTDGDGIPNFLDIDSDGDGITDNVEAQGEGYYIAPLGRDSDSDGWDDAYDPDDNGNYFDLADTDKDGTPDFLDINSDDDYLNDIIEASVADSHTINIIPLFIDSDRDGLDDAFDIQDGYKNPVNPTASNVLLPDSDKDGVRNWRDYSGKDIIPGEDSNLKNKLQFTVFPNPASQKFEIDIPALSTGNAITINIISLTGQLVYTGKINKNNQEINPGNLVSGQYLVVLKKDNTAYTRRLIIKR